MGNKIKQNKWAKTIGCNTPFPKQACEERSVSTRPASEQRRSGSQARALLLLLLLRCLRDGGVRVDGDDDHDGGNDVIVNLIITIAAKQPQA